jgi:hypothetical protein
MAVHTVDAPTNKVKGYRSPVHLASVVALLMLVVHVFAGNVAVHWCQPVAGSAMQ